ncbi:MAG TPA: hypothetical protein VGK88_04690 [bacterium]|jgi:uncharacterized coiled-coil DUF342 family protein
MGWLDKVKEGMEKAAGQAEEMAAVGKLRVEIRSLTGKMEDAFKAIGAKVYDLHEAGTAFPAEVDALVQAADQFADQIKAKEAEIEELRKT